MNRIFISYRRAENQFAAGALARELRQRFGQESVFRDRESIGGGVAWKEHLLEELSEGSALLVLMGKNWAQITDGEGQRRLDSPDDPVRLEIADGLRDRAFVLPILIEDATMPRASELPEDIRAIADFNALQLRDGDWQHDFDAICKALKQGSFKHKGPGWWRRNRLRVSWVLNVFALLASFAPEKTLEAARTFFYWCLAALVLALLAWRDPAATPRSKWWALGAAGVAGAFCAYFSILAFRLGTYR